MFKCYTEPMKFPLSVSPSKENGRAHEAKEKYTTSVGIEPTTSVFDRRLLNRLSYETSREQVVGDYGGNCGNVNVKGTNECSVLRHNIHLYPCLLACVLREKRTCSGVSCFYVYSDSRILL